MLFLDIEMPGMTALNSTKNLKRKAFIIFTTAKPDYAVGV
jgi:DNA-binding LytR/AlgR family response regulator